MRKLFFFILLNSFIAFSQNFGQLSGKILDSKTQLPIEGVNILLEGTQIGSITDNDGYFNIENINPKTYNVIISHIGYQPKTLFNIIVKKFGTPNIQVFIENSANELDEIVLIQSPFKASIETPLSIRSFSAVEIETYPGGNNDITKVIQSMPGISPSIGGFRNDVIIRGGAPNESVYYLDGIEIPNINHFSTQGSAGGPVGMLNVSFVREVTLASSAFGAEYDNPLYLNSIIPLH